MQIALYEGSVAETVCAFQTTPPTVRKWRERGAHLAAQYPAEIAAARRAATTTGAGKDNGNGTTAARLAAAIIAVYRHESFQPHTLLTDITPNGPTAASAKSAHAPGNRKVDQTCQQHNITHKLTPIRRPQTAGGAERCNRRFSEAMARLPKYNTGKSYGRNCFRNHDERNAFVLNFTRNYNHTKQRRMNAQSPVQVPRTMQQNGSIKKYNHAGHNKKYKYGSSSSAIVATSDKYLLTDCMRGVWHFSRN